MFIYRSGPHILILLLYLDDIIITSSAPTLIYSFIDRLSHEFAMKDLGDLHYFLGVQVVRTPSSLFLSQHKYVLDLIKRFRMHTCKHVRTSVASKTSLTLLDGELLVDPTEYRSMVGALQYLTMTRPDIVYIIHIVFQFMHVSRTTHLHAVKRIFRYLHGTADHGLHLQSSKVPSLVVAYSDGD